jgi:DNA-binding GntR family transcriptional regulator
MPQPRATQTQRAYTYLRQELLRGRWQAGDTLSAYALAKELQISRTPAMEALKRLEQDGLVEIIPQVGCRVVGPSTDALAELFAVRAGIEGVAADAAARRIDDDALAELQLLLHELDAAADRSDGASYAGLNQRLHLLVLEAARMPRLNEFARGVWTPLGHQLARLPISDAQVRESAAEHRELYEALVRHAPPRARAAAERHVRLAAARFAAELERPAPDQLEHRALIYRDEADFLAATEPFVREGLAAGERVLAVTTPHNVEMLGRALGPQATEVEFRDSAEWYVLPSHTLLAYERYVEASDRPRVRVIGEVTANGRAAPVSEWIRYESIINVAFALQPVTFMCPYDTRALPERIVADARRTHPQLCHGAAISTSDDYTDPTTLLRERAAEAFPEPPTGPVRELSVDHDLRAVRAFVLDEARHAGVTGKALQDTFLAVEEIAAGVVGPGTLRAWAHDDHLLFELRDDGIGIGDPLLGQLPTDPAGTFEPRGLWMARLLCDLVEVRTSDRGLIVRLHISLAD